MAEKESKKKTKKGTKKAFYEVSAPLTSTQIYLYGTSPEDLDNKTVRLDLTKALRGKSLVLKLKVKNDNSELSAYPESIELAVSYIRRIMRKGISYVEDSFETDARDAVVKIKPFLITRRKVSRAILNSLRENTKKFLTAYVKTRDSEEIFSEIISNKLQKQLSQKLKKIYPLALCEIRVFEVVKKK